MVSEPVFWMTVFSGCFEREQPSGSHARVATSRALAESFIKRESDRRVGGFIGLILVLSEDRLNKIPDMVGH